MNIVFSLFCFRARVGRFSVCVLEMAVFILVGCAEWLGFPHDFVIGLI